MNVFIFFLKRKMLFCCRFAHSIRPFLTRKFFQEILGLEGSKKILRKFRQVHNLKISDCLLRSKSFFQENIPGFIWSVFRSTRGGDGVGWEDADGRVSDG